MSKFYLHNVKSGFLRYIVKRSSSDSDMQPRLGTDGQGDLWAPVFPKTIACNWKHSNYEFILVSFSMDSNDGFVSCI